MSKPLTATTRQIDDTIVRAEAAPETTSSFAATEAQPAPTLITEQEVVLGAAAAVPAPSTRWWWRRTIRVIVVATHRVFAPSPEDSRAKRRHYPSQLTFVEDARMKREMYRL